MRNGTLRWTMSGGSARSTAGGRNRATARSVIGAITEAGQERKWNLSGLGDTGREARRDRVRLGPGHDGFHSSTLFSEAAPRCRPSPAGRITLQDRPKCRANDGCRRRAVSAGHSCCGRRRDRHRGRAGLGPGPGESGEGPRESGAGGAAVFGHLCRRHRHRVQLLARPKG